MPAATPLYDVKTHDLFGVLNEEVRDIVTNRFSPEFNDALRVKGHDYAENLLFGYGKMLEEPAVFSEAIKSAIKLGIAWSVATNFVELTDTGKSNVESLLRDLEESPTLFDQDAS